MNKWKIKPTRKWGSIALLLWGNLFLCLTVWLLNTYDQICFDQIMFQMKSSSAGVHRALAGGIIFWVIGLGSVITAVEAFAFLLLSGKLKKLGQENQQYLAYLASKPCRFFHGKSLLFGGIVFVFGAVFAIVELDVAVYAKTVLTNSFFIEENYVDPDHVTITFPEKKRNLIYIFLESMETTFGDEKAGEKKTPNYIPELMELAGENINFSHTEGIGGAYSVAGTTWTASAMVSHTSGVPVKIAFTATTYGAEDEFMPGLTSLGEILEKEGYNQTLLVGSDAAFHGRELYFTQHGAYQIADVNSLKEEGRLDEDYREWWGFEDEKLFAYAKEELLRLSEEEEPFNFTMLTADTHFPDGYSCRLCEDQYESPYANVLSCSSRQVDEFLSWIKEQPFYENTTVIITGDHLTMDAEFMDGVPEDYVRTVYNCFLNTPIAPVKEKERGFATFDMFPTTLAALGAEIEGERLGLGTNLFSSEKTLIETYGYDFLDLELQKKSSYYNKNFLK